MYATKVDDEDEIEPYLNKLSNLFQKLQDIGDESYSEDREDKVLEIKKRKFGRKKLIQIQSI